MSAVFIFYLYPGASEHYLFPSSSPTASLNASSTAYLLTPYIDSPTSCLSFRFLLSGADVGQLSVYDSLQGQPIWIQQGNYGTEWGTAMVTGFYLRGHLTFVGQQKGDGSAGDIAISDVEITYEECESPGI